MSDASNDAARDPAATASGVPMWFWIVAVVALLWNLMGLMAFVMDITASAETLASQYDEVELAAVKQIPNWAKGAYGVAVIFGVLGCIGLLMRKKWAFPCFVLSLAGVLVQHSYFYFMSDMIQIMGAVVLPLMISVLVVAIALAAASQRWMVKGWLV